ncbi:DUF402 domain-containing protein [Nocardioides sp.]|uniref:DUF402 domain-containing protein n=1 Tax=Nocardioides sp. TaxID=35761 RepID=UPI003563D3DC
MTPAPGDAVRVEMTKWGERPHWEYDAVLLGSDQHGDWIGVPAGTPMTRPGASYVAQVDQVTLAPAETLEQRGWVATFHGAGGHSWERLGSPVDVYVDITSPAHWAGAVLRATDLDLDVIRGVTGRVWVDDEDEFADHRVRFGYPDEVIAAALTACSLVHAALTTSSGPFDGSAREWLARVAHLRA